MGKGKPTKLKRGGQTKFTPELQEAICRDLALGVSRKTASHCNGIAPRTLQNWLRRGRDEESPFDALLSAVKKAEQEAERRSIAIIQKVAAGGYVTERRTINRSDGTTEIVEKVAQPEWTAAAWTSERLNPSRWGQNRFELQQLRIQVAELAALLASVNRGTHTDLPDPPAVGASEAAVCPPTTTG